MVVSDVLEDERTELPVVRNEAVLVVRLESTAATGDVSAWMRPADEPLEEREPTEHSAGAVVRRKHGVLDAEAAQAVARLQAAGSAADDNDRVLAGRKRGVYRHRFASRTRRASAW